MLGTLAIMVLVTESTTVMFRKKKPKGTPGSKESSSGGAPFSPRDECGTSGPSTFNNMVGLAKCFRVFF